MCFCSYLQFLLFLFFAVSCAGADTQVLVTDEGNWPQFRGPGGLGIGSGDFPTHFGASTNLLWQASVPPGHSSPCIWGEKMFLTGFGNSKLETVCLDRRDGKVLWSREVEPGKIERGARLSDPATGTPATDGERVYVYFGAFGLVSYDFAGNEVWRKPLPVPILQHGAGTSPIVVQGKVLLNRDDDVSSCFLAMDSKTGEEKWRLDRPEFRRSFATPFLWPTDSPQIAVLPGTLRVVAYALVDGHEVWSVRGLANEMVTSAVAGDGMIFVAGWTPGSGVARMQSFDSLLASSDKDGDGKISRSEATSGPARQHFLYIDANKDGFITRKEWDTIAAIFDESQNVLLAIRPDGQGDVTSSHVAWKQTRGLPYCPSPLFYDGRVYTVKNGGLASCYDAKSGAIHFQQERLGALGDYYASPVAANGKVLMISVSGTAVVLKAGDTLEVLAQNVLGEEVVASPAIVGRTLFIRGRTHCFAFQK